MTKIIKFDYNQNLLLGGFSGEKTLLSDGFCSSSSRHCSFMGFFMFIPQNQFRLIPKPS